MTTNNRAKESEILLEFSKKELANYVGMYYSPELDTHYHFKNKAGKLIGNHARHGDFTIKKRSNGDLEGDLWVFDTIKIKRDKDDKVEGIYVSNGRVRNMWFEKMQ